MGVRAVLVSNGGHFAIDTHVFASSANNGTGRWLADCEQAIGFLVIAYAQGAGWEFVHVAIDDASRIAYAKIMPDEKIGSVTEFLREALAHFASFGIPVRQLMSDNGPAYRLQPIAAFLQNLGIVHIFTRPYTPRTNGKAKRFIQTTLREWAYVAVYQNSAHRQQHLQP